MRCVLVRVRQPPTFAWGGLPVPLLLYIADDFVRLSCFVHVFGFTKRSQLEARVLLLGCRHTCILRISHFFFSLDVFCRYSVCAGRNLGSVTVIDRCALNDRETKRATRMKKKNARRKSQQQQHQQPKRENR